MAISPNTAGRIRIDSQPNWSVSSPPIGGAVNGQIRDHLSQLVDAIDVADNRARQHQPAARARTLQDSPDDQNFDAGRHHSNGRADSEQDEPSEQNGQPPETVRDAAIDQRRERHHHHGKAEGKLRGRFADRECLAHMGQRG